MGNPAMIISLNHNKQLLTPEYGRWKNLLILCGALIFSPIHVKSAAAQTAKVVVAPGADIGAAVNAAVASLPNRTGTLELPGGSYVQSTSIKITGNNIRLTGAGTTLNYNPA